MNLLLPDTAVELAAAAERAFGDLGGVDAARAAEADPTYREGPVTKALAALGVEDLDPRADAEALAAAAAMCQAAGRVALPYPLPSVLLGTNGVPLTPVPDAVCRVDHGTLFAEWRVATLDGKSHISASMGGALQTRLGPFVSDLKVGMSTDAVPAVYLAIHLSLTAWTILGTVERAIEVAVDHVNNRVQFGKPISVFQSVQFQLADAAVAMRGLRELAGYTLWRISDDPDGCLTDALALRVHALDVARAVLRTCQQLHGAAGLCDEYDISILCRHVQPALRLPFGAEQGVTELMARVNASGFDGLFPHGAARS